MPVNSVIQYATFNESAPSRAQSEHPPRDYGDNRRDTQWRGRSSVRAAPRPSLISAMASASPADDGGADHTGDDKRRG